MFLFNIPSSGIERYPEYVLFLGSSESSERWPYAGTAAAIKEMGAKHVDTDVSQVHVDQKNKVAYFYIIL